MIELLLCIIMEALFIFIYCLFAFFFFVGEGGGGGDGEGEHRLSWLINMSKLLRFLDLDNSRVASINSCITVAT